MRARWDAATATATRNYCCCYCGSNSGADVGRPISERFFVFGAGQVIAILQVLQARCNKCTCVARGIHPSYRHNHSFLTEARGGQDVN